jgi:hypothetical protein
MIDRFHYLSDTVVMLTAPKNASNREGSATPLTTVADLRADLEFVAANQQLEGFSGTITDAVANYEPDLAEIAESARSFGAQVPSQSGQLSPPLFPR